MADTITNAIDFFDKINEEKEVTIKFIKKDKTVRIMKCTLDFETIPRSQHPKDLNMRKILNDMNVHKLLRVYDLEKRDWRSVPFDRVQWLETPDTMYNIIPK